MIILWSHLYAMYHLCMSANAKSDDHPRPGHNVQMEVTKECVMVTTKIKLIQYKMNNEEHYKIEVSSIY